MGGTYQEQIRTTLQDPRLQSAIYAASGRLMDHRRHAIAPEELPDFQELRAQARLIKQHTLDNLDYYLEQFEQQVTARGGQLVWARDGQDVAEFVVDLARRKQARLIVKSKSMTTEEIDLRERLEPAGLETVETDLGEYILQLAGERPSHIVAPALHKTREDVGELFSRRLGVPYEHEPARLTKIARAVLREKFLAADLGMTGANFLVADSGAVVLVENEGNARLSTSAPRIHVAVAGLEKLIPRAQDLAVFLKLLGRSATGQALTVYTSFLSGPRRAEEIDGPDEFYVVLLDNGRSKLLADGDKRQSLYCIRCGACLSHCPVYRKIGGHSYPWVYSGPIGAVITPQFQGLTEAAWLPFASSLCGACGEVCPVKIELPKLLLELRSEIQRARSRQGENRWEKLAFRAWAWVMRHPRIYEMLGMMAAAAMPGAEAGGWLERLPKWVRRGPLQAWISQRELPPLPEHSFRQLWRQRVRTGGS